MKKGLSNLQIKLETSRLVLQVLFEDSAHLVCEFYQNNRAHLSPWEQNTAPNYYTIGFQAKNLRAEFEMMKKGTFLRYWIFEKNDPRTPIGSLCFQNIARGAFHSCQIGYKIDQRHTGSGYASEAALSGIRHMFSDLRLHRIEALIQTDNFPSIRLVEKLGFHCEGLSESAVFIQNSWHDIFRYALVNHDVPYSFYLPS